MRKRIRVSYGSAVELGLAEGRLATSPRTAYLLMGEGACRGKCAFCPQSVHGAPGHVARVSWPQFPLESVLGALSSSASIERVCLQCPDEEAVMDELPHLVGMAAGRHPVSVSMPPWSAELMAALKGAGAERLTIPIDCASPKLFHAVKGREMRECVNALGKAVEVFGRGMVGTHVIVGLGETEEEVVSLIARLLAMGVTPALFALTPVRGTAMEGERPPPLASYRRLQLALYMMEELGVGGESFSCDSRGRLVCCPVERSTLGPIVKGGKPFETRGCPGCNRPYFNERVSGPLYNFPRPPTQVEIKDIEEDLFGGA